MNENWYAFYISIVKEVPPEIAFAMMEGKKDTQWRKLLTDEDKEDMIKLREQGLTYKEIGYMYGLSKTAIGHHIERYKKKGEAS